MAEETKEQAEGLDVYRDWLGIRASQRPLNYYQLLRLKNFEDDPQRIRSNYRKLNAHVRKFAVGDYAKQSQELLNELAKAMLCLTDTRRKEEYDTSLGRSDTAAHRSLKSVEELLVAREIITQEQLSKAQKYSDATGLDIRDAVVQQKFAKPDVVTQVYAEAHGLPYIELEEIQVDGSLIVSLPAVFCRQHSVVPLLRDQGQLMVASPQMLSPQVEEELRLRLGLPVRSTLCTPATIHEMINKHYSKDTAAFEMVHGGPGGSTAKGKRKIVVQKNTSSGPEDKAQVEERQKIRFAVAALLGVVTMMVHFLGFASPTASMVTSMFFGLIVGGIAALAMKFAGY